MKLIFHSLTMQLGMVLLLALASATLLLGLLRSEVGSIVERTRCIAAAAEVNDHAAQWMDEIAKPRQIGERRSALRMEALEGAILAMAPALGQHRKAELDSMVAAYEAFTETEFGRKMQDGRTGEDSRALAQKKLITSLLRLQLGVRRDRAEDLVAMEKSLHQVQTRILICLAVFIGLLATLALIVRFRILHPLRRLEKGAREIGEGKLGYQVFVPTRDEMGKLARVFNGMSTGLREQKDAEQRLQRLEAIDEIVRSVNHEINNPLMIISGSAEFLAAVLPDLEPPLRAKLDTIIEEVRRIFVVTQRLKEIRQPVTQNYTNEGDPMIDLARSSTVLPRDTLI